MHNGSVGCDNKSSASTQLVFFHPMNCDPQTPTHTHRVNCVVMRWNFHEICNDCKHLEFYNHRMFHHIIIACVNVTLYITIYLYTCVMDG